MGRILITGALGQIGTDLTIYLIEKYGEDRVIATDLQSKISSSDGKDQHSHIPLDCMDYDAFMNLVKNNDVEMIFHLASMLSYAAENKPLTAWNINMGCLLNVLEISRLCHCRAFVPSSIASFGPLTQINDVPQNTIQRPNTMYGITKVAGELLCDYYYTRYRVDTRGVRYPGLISYKALPGGGTTDYAVEIFYEALKNRKYNCYLEKGTFLDMMYMPDAIKAAVRLSEAESDRLINRNAYNITALSIAPEDLAFEIKKIIPEFEIEYQPDPLRQSIADSWPNSLDDSAAREEWEWKPDFDISKMTVDMLKKLAERLQINVSTKK